MCLQDRVEIQVGIAKNMSDRAIAAVVSKNRTTVLREVRAGGGRLDYCAETADARAIACARRPKELRLVTEDGLRVEVEEGLAKRWSPAAISMGTGGRVCAETIYRAVYAGRRGPLSVEACRRLVSKRRQRRPRGPKTTAKRNVLGAIRPLSARPAAAGLRWPGHWEGDLIVGSMNRSAIVTLACRASRFTLLADLPEGHSAPEVSAALVELFDRIPAHLRSTLTWDQGREMADWTDTEALIGGLTIYFCDPHSPWQRATNENTNGLLRQYFPKGTDLSVHSAADLDRVAAELNDRPRKRFGFAKPDELIGPLLLPQ